MYFTFHAVRFAAVFALAGKNIVILLVTLSENFDYILSTFFFFLIFCSFPYLSANSFHLWQWAMRTLSLPLRSLQ